MVYGRSAFFRCGAVVISHAVGVVCELALGGSGYSVYNAARRILVLIISRKLPRLPSNMLNFP